MKISFAAFLFSVVLISCRYNQDYHTVNHNNEFQISLPGWIKKEKLAEEAVLSYANRYRNFYFVLLTHSKNMVEDTFYNHAYTRIHHVLDSAQTSEEKLTVGTLGGKHMSFNGKMGDEKEKIYYELYLLNGQKHRYEICLWTRGEERHKKYREDFYKIIQSFKEI